MDKKKLNEVDMFKMGKKEEDKIIQLDNQNNVNNIVNTEVNSVNVNVNTNVNNNKFKIMRPQLEDETMRMTYHLKVSTIRKIKVMARHADMGVSEFLQQVLDYAIDNIEIEGE